MEGSGSAAPAPAAKEKARFRAAEHAQSLALSRSDKEAEKAAMEKAEEQAEDKEDEGGRQAAANVLSGMEDDTSSGGGHSRDKTQLSVPYPPARCRVCWPLLRAYAHGTILGHHAAAHFTPGHARTHVFWRCMRSVVRQEVRER